MGIVKPIFIIGVARSGTTLLYNPVATHPELGWFSHLTDNHPEIKQLPILHGVLDVPLIGDGVKRPETSAERFWLTPGEAVHIYRESCGFEHAGKSDGRRPDCRNGAGVQGHNRESSETHR